MSLESLYKSTSLLWDPWKEVGSHRWSRIMLRYLGSLAIPTISLSSHLFFFSIPSTVVIATLYNMSGHSIRGRTSCWYNHILNLLVNPDLSIFLSQSSRSPPYSFNCCLILGATIEHINELTNLSLIINKRNYISFIFSQHFHSSFEK